MRLVRIFGVLGVLAGAGPGGPVMAADAPGSPPSTAAPAPADAAAIRGVIQRQMDAFRRDDGAAAFAFASPGIQAQFGDAGTFMDMVRRGYQPVYHPRSTSFGALRREDGKLVQHVEVVGPDGASREALYFMERETDGSWRIGGCTLVDSPDVAA